MVGVNLYLECIEAVSELWTEIIVGFTGNPPLPRDSVSAFSPYMVSAEIIL